MQKTVVVIFAAESYLPAISHGAFESSASFFRAALRMEISLSQQ